MVSLRRFVVLDSVLGVELAPDQEDATTSCRDAREWGGASLCKTCRTLGTKAQGRGTYIRTNEYSNPNIEHAMFCSYYSAARIPQWDWDPEIHAAQRPPVRRRRT